MDKKYLFKFNLYVSLVFLVETALCTDDKFEACEPRNCGIGPNISYPFWIHDRQESYCGYPGFELVCNEDMPILRISEDDYVIHQIFYQNQSLLVSNAAVKANSCSLPIHNVTIEKRLFNFDPSQSFIFLFSNCRFNSTKDYINQTVGCSSDDAKHHSVVLFDQDPRVNYLKNSSFCNSYVVTPVRRDADTSITIRTITQRTYVELLMEGFVLKWNAINCSFCEDSGGRCGYDSNESIFQCFCPDRPHRTRCLGGNAGTNIINRAVLFSIVGICIIVAILVTFCYLKRKYSTYNSVKFWKMKTQRGEDLEAFLRDYGSLAPRRYKYSDVKKMTNSFKEKLGQGGYGFVFKGKLPDERFVAVKVLNESKGDGEEFINEVASISNTSHINIVKLIGFCIEGPKRVLIYEFMPNGSLEKLIYYEKPKDICLHIGWEKLYKIAIGIARGLEYLHRGCNTRILHFDIKPHNILLDQDFSPKISDFGLAKICHKNESIISMVGARGTAGYIAPEVLCRNIGGVSHKSDVYSYGMMVLEMVGGRKNIDVRVDNSSEIYFPHWIYKRIELDEDLNLDGVITEEEKEVARKMILVALWCIQTDPSSRPSMNKVLEMLEGSIASLPIPPKPYLSSP